MMQPKILATILAVAVTAGCQSISQGERNLLTSGRFDGIEGISAFDEPRAFKALASEIKLADFEFHLNERDQLTLMELNPPGSFELYRHTRFPLNQQDGPNREFPGFVVVQLEKLAQVEGVEQKVLRINQFFFSRGSSRVLVTGFRSSSRSIYSDKLIKPNKSWEVSASGDCSWFAPCGRASVIRA